jgi:hypothetical protein
MARIDSLVFVIVCNAPNFCPARSGEKGEKQVEQNLEQLRQEMVQLMQQVEQTRGSYVANFTSMKGKEPI